MPQPLLLLDVESVLNPFGLDQPLPGFVPFGLFPDEEIVVINPQHGIWIDELAALYDIVWISSWDDDANQMFAPLLNLEPSAVLAVPAGSVDDLDAKAGLIADLGRGRPVCWIDEVHGEAARRWAATRQESTLLLTVDRATGFGRDHVEAALTFASGSQKRSDVTLQRQ